MNTTQKALTLALEWLERNTYGNEADELFDALTAALAEQTAHHIASAGKMIEQPAQQEPVGSLSVRYFRGSKSMTNTDFDYYGDLPEGDYELHTSPPAQRKWLDPNDKTQKQYLPHIGEPVLFCHKGMTYVGKHTGGSFQSEVTNQYFNTWECHWMYLPAAYGIKP